MWPTSSGNSLATTTTRRAGTGRRPTRPRPAGPTTRRHAGRLDVADPRPARDDQPVDRHDPAAQRVGRLELDERRAEDRREDVGRAGQGQADPGQREREGEQPERGDRQAPADDGDHDRPADPPDRRDPARTAARRGTSRPPAPRRAGRSPPAPSWNTSSASTGKSEVGIPKIIALRSITKLPRMARRCRANRSPSAIAASPGRATPPSGGSGRIANRAVSVAMKLTTSTAYAPAMPTVAMSSPPTAGPTIDAVWKLSWLSAMAAGSRSGGTSRGIADDAGRLVDGTQPGRHEGDREQRRDRRLAAQREQRQGQAAGGQPGLGDHQQAAAIDRVGQRPGAEREQQDRDQLEERQRSDREGRTGQDVDLERQGDPGDLVADPGDDLARPQPAVVAVAAKRRRVEEEPPRAAPHRPDRARAEPAIGAAPRRGASSPRSRLRLARFDRPARARPRRRRTPRTNRPSPGRPGPGRASVRWSGVAPRAANGEPAGASNVVGRAAGRSTIDLDLTAGVALRRRSDSSATCGTR